MTNVLTPVASIEYATDGEVDVKVHKKSTGYDVDISSGENSIKLENLGLQSLQHIHSIFGELVESKKSSAPSIRSACLNDKCRKVFQVAPEEKFFCSPECRKEHNQ